MYTRPCEIVGARPPLKSQVAYAVVIDPPSEWPPSTTWRPCSGGLDHAVEVLDLDVHPPAAGERDVGVGDQLEVVGDRSGR